MERCDRGGVLDYIAELAVGGIFGQSGQAERR